MKIFELRKILIFLCVCSFVSIHAIDTRQGSNNEYIRSLQVFVDGDDFAPPIICMNTDDRLVVKFDHLAEDREYLRYRLVHCNADWQPSNLVDSEFLDGFNEGRIESFDFSQQTTVHYVNYTLVIPNEEVRPLISGNYLLQIYPENDADDIWAQCRFMVSEQTAIIDAMVTTRTDIDYNSAHQQLQISVDIERSNVVDPFNETTILIEQNRRTDNQHTLQHPMRMSGRNKLVYEHQPELIFPAGNEYRRFENVSTTYPGMNVDRISYTDPYYMFDLAVDEPRANKMYLYDQTKHGAYLVREYNSDNSDIEADYSLVLFSLDMPELRNANVFIEGDLTDRRIGPESLMTYNPVTDRYERVLLLKQGAYNYQYLVVTEGKTEGITAIVDGDKFQTVNEYLIKVYTRHPGDRYDRLIGVSRIMSAQ